MNALNKFKNKVFIINSLDYKTLNITNRNNNEKFIFKNDTITDNLITNKSKFKYIIIHTKDNKNIFILDANEYNIFRKNNDLIIESKIMLYNFYDSTFTTTNREPIFNTQYMPEYSISFSDFSMGSSN